MSDLSIHERAAIALALLQLAEPADLVGTLQAAQQLIQAELARLWAQAEGMPGPGFLWPQVKRESKR